MTFIHSHKTMVTLGEATADALIACALASDEPISRLAMLGEATLREAMRKNRIQRRYANAATVARLRAKHRTLKAAWFRICLAPDQCEAARHVAVSEDVSVKPQGD